MKKSNPAPAMPKTRAAEERKWRAEDAVRTLQRAEEIKRDSKLMADVRAHAQQQKSALAKIARSGPK